MQSRRAWVGALVLSAMLATAAQWAPIAWRLQGHHGGYYGDVDEQFYAALVRRAAQAPLTTTDPFDVQWRHAASPYGVLLPRLLGLPDRLGAPPGAWSDLSRWLGSGASAWLLIRLGTEAASPAVGAAAATLTLLDPGSYYGKPLLRLATGRWEPATEAQQLPMSRLFTPGYLLPFYLAALLVLLRAVGPRGGAGSGTGGRGRDAGSRRWVAILAFAAVGLAGYFFFWTAALAAAVAVAVLHPRRRALRRWVVPALVAMVIGVLLNGLGGHDDPVQHALRLGFVRTRRPQFLLHAGYWAGAVVAAWLALGRYRGRSGARALGLAAVGIWALVLLMSPLTGWDPQAHHYNMALDPAVTLVWCTAAWYAWRRLRRPGLGLPRAAAAGAAAAGVSLAAFLGPTLAMRGLAAAPRLDWGGARQLAADARVGPTAQVAVPRSERYALGLTLPNTPYWYPYDEAWGVSDTALFNRTVCAALITGEDSTATSLLATPRQEAATVWPDGRPAGVSVAGRRDYFSLMPVLADSEAAAVGALGRDPAALRARCRALPGYALAEGRPEVRRAAAVAAALGGAPAWVAPDSGRAWFRFPSAAGSP